MGRYDKIQKILMEKSIRVLIIFYRYVHLFCRPVRWFVVELREGASGVCDQKEQPCFWITPEAPVICDMGSSESFLLVAGVHPTSDFL